MLRIFKKFFVSLRTLGVRKTLFWIYFGYFKINRFFLFRRDVNDIFTEIQQGEHIVIKQVSLKELDTLRNTYTNLPEEFFCDIYEGAKTCFVGFVGGKMANIFWVFFGGDRSRFFNLKEKEAEINYAVTLPEFRGQNLYPLTVRSISKWLKENQYRYLYGAIHEENKSAIKAIGKCGFKKIGEIRHLSFYRPKWKGTES
jgi:RimJ/RimL family protein N-acetyltransferase